MLLPGIFRDRGSKQKPLGRKRRDEVTSHGTGSSEKVLWVHWHDRWNRPRLPELPLILSTCSEFPGSPFRLCVHPNNRYIFGAMRMSQPWLKHANGISVKFWSNQTCFWKGTDKEAFLPLNERVLFFFWFNSVSLTVSSFSFNRVQRTLSPNFKGKAKDISVI